MKNIQIRNIQNKIKLSQPLNTSKFRYSKKPNHNRCQSNPFILNNKIYSKEAQGKIKKEIDHRRTKSQNSISEMLQFNKQLCQKQNKDLRVSVRRKSKTPTNSSSQIRLLGSKLASREPDSFKDDVMTRIKQGVYTIDSCEYRVRWDGQEKCVRVECGTREVDFTSFMNLLRRFRYTFKEEMCA